MPTLRDTLAPVTAEYDPLDTRAHDAAEAKDAEAKRLKREREVADFTWLMNHPEGRRIVYRLLEKAGNARSSFSLNANEMAFWEGNRNFGIFLQAEIDAICPERYHQMVKEAKKDASTRSSGNPKR